MSTKGFGKAVAGIDVDINLSVDTRPMRDASEKSGDLSLANLTVAEMAGSVSGSITLGASVEGAVGVEIARSDGGVLEQNGSKFCRRKMDCQ